MIFLVVKRQLRQQKGDFVVKKPFLIVFESVSCKQKCSKFELENCSLFCLAGCFPLESAAECGIIKVIGEMANGRKAKVCGS